MANAPSWLIDEEAIVEPIARHEWMCRQLKDRRQAQIRGATGRLYESLLNQLFDFGTPASPPSDFAHETDPLVGKVFEVLSDGLGYVEPNWHALVSDGEIPEIVAPDVLAQFHIRIRKLRDRLSTGTRTQRAIGNSLYESALFAVSNEGVWLLAMKPGAETWAPLPDGNDDVLPLKRGGQLTLQTLASSDPAASLIAIARSVHWPAFLVGAQPSECLSLVLLHTSLWHEAAGVWAFHVRCNGATKIEPKSSVNLSSLRALVAPAVCCLEDVTGWAYEREGLHRVRQHNVNFRYHCLGITTPPRWDPDGFPSAGVDRAMDSLVYNLPAQAPVSVATSEILRIARDKGTCECGNWGLVELAFIATRLGWQEKSDRGWKWDQTTPSTVQLYADHLLRRLGKQGSPIAEVDGVTMVGQVIDEIRQRTDLCGTCAGFAANLQSYWQLVTANTAQG